MDINVILNVMMELFIIIVIGYFLFKTGIFDKNFNQKLTKLILHVTMPCLILNSVLKQTKKPPITMVRDTFVVGVAIFIVLPIVGIIVAKLIRADLKKQGMYAFMMTYSNIGFMGIPVIGAIYGSTAVFYTAIINIVFNVTIFTLGMIVLRYGGGVNSKMNIGKLLSPGVLFSVAAIFVYLFNIRFTGVIETSIASIGSVTTPLAMLLMGSTLATMPLRQVFNEGKVYLFCVIKQIIIPVILYPTVKYFINDSTLFGVVMILLMMPIATNSIMFAIENNGDEKLAAKSVFISTVMSIVTIPLILYVFKM